MSTIEDAVQNMSLSSKPSLPLKGEPGKMGKAIEANCNIMPLHLIKNISFFKYDIRMNAIFTKKDGSEGFKEFAKITRDDYIEQERKKACVEIFTYLKKTEKVFAGHLIYDRAAILFTTKKLEGITGETKFTLPATSQTVCPEAVRIEVLVKQAADSFQVTSNDLASVINADFKGESKGLLEVLNLATSQTAFLNMHDFITYGNGNIYLMDPQRYGFHANEAPVIGNDKYVGIGMSKGVKILEGNLASGDKCMAAMVLDVKKTAFHFDDFGLSKKLNALYGDRLPSTTVLTRELKDVRCLCTHKKASVVIGGFTSMPIGKATFKGKEGQIMSIVKYYQERYNMKIENTHFPGVIDKHTKNIYPTDFLKVAPNQRVKATQANAGVVEQLIKVSAVKPEIRFKQSQMLSQLLKMSPKEAGAFGIHAKPQFMTVPARQLDPVTLLGGVGSMDGPAWRASQKFVVGATVDKWASFLFYTPNQREDVVEAFKSFIGKLKDGGNKRGMKIPHPTLVSQFLVSGNVEDQVSGAVESAAQAGCTFVMIVTDTRLKTHDQLKVDELKYGLTTQEVTLKVAVQVGFQNKVQTLENVIMKTNQKLRGMNHVVKADGGLMHSTDTAILGIFVQQPRGMTAKEIENSERPSMPAVIGLSCNNGCLQAAAPQQREVAAQQYFTTAWKFANPNEWNEGESQRTTLKNMVVDALKQFKSNRGRVPNKVVVYRGGVSEGQLPYVAGEERCALLEAFRMIHPSYNPQLLIIGCSKDHNERFYRKTFPTATPGQKVDTNLPAGFILDKVAVNSELKEFYLQAHKALQGTARATKYTVLHESSGKLSNDAIQHMTNCLCHLHEIVNSTTAIPTPLYVAEESAKRAVNVYNYLKGGVDHYDLDEINKQLAPHGLGARINA